MKYLVYKITNTINGKFYIGKHQTQNINDGYMGSGKMLRTAIKKYGIENFKKEILHVFDTEEEMNAKEKELVVISENTYNLCEGGKGGFSYINRNRLNFNLLNLPKEKLYEAKIAGGKNRYKKHGPIRSNAFIEAGKNSFKNKKHSEKTIQKMKDKKVNFGIGKSNSQYGTFWITNGLENKKIKKDQPIHSGWCKGRTMK